MDGRSRQGYYGRPQSQSPWHDPYQKTPSWGRGISELIKNFMMMKQLKEERGEKEWERGFKEEEQERRFEHLGAQEELWGAQAEKIGRPVKSKLSAGVEAALIVTGQGDKPREEVDWKPVGQLLEKWRTKKTTPSLEWQQEKFRIDSLKELIDSGLTRIQRRIKEIKDPEYRGGVRVEKELSGNDLDALMELSMARAEFDRLLNLLTTEGKLDKQNKERIYKLFRQVEKAERKIQRSDSLLQKALSGDTKESVLPQEVQDFLSRHPEMDVGTALELYRKWKKQ